jgi:hypothetical protein
MPVIPVLRRLRQEDLEFETKRGGYIVSSGIALKYSKTCLGKHLMNSQCRWHEIHRTETWEQVTRLHYFWAPGHCGQDSEDKETSKLAFRVEGWGSRL